MCVCLCVSVSFYLVSDASCLRHVFSTWVLGWLLTTIYNTVSRLLVRCNYGDSHDIRSVRVNACSMLMGDPRLNYMGDPRLAFELQPTRVKGEIQGR